MVLRDTVSYFFKYLLLGYGLQVNVLLNIFVKFSAIGRTLIPRYFRSIFEGGVTDLHYVLKYPKESFHNTTITLDCDHALMVTQHGKPMFTNVGLLTIFSNSCCF